MRTCLSDTCSRTQIHAHVLAKNKRTHTCFLSASALTPCAFRVAGPPSLPTAICCTNMAAPPKDTIFAYWRATLLVTKGHAAKILNL